MTRFTVLSALVLSLAFTPSARPQAEPARAAQIRKEIAELEAKLAELKRELARAEPPPSAAVFGPAYRDAQVEVRIVRVAPIRNGEALAIRFEIKNLSDAKRLEAGPWRGRVFGAAVTDDAGNTYQVTGGRAVDADDQPITDTKPTLDPGKFFQAEVHVKTPVEKATALSVVVKTGTVGGMKHTFAIPRSAWAK